MNGIFALTGLIY